MEISISVCSLSRLKELRHEAVRLENMSVSFRSPFLTTLHNSPSAPRRGNHNNDGDLQEQPSIQIHFRYITMQRYFTLNLKRGNLKDTHIYKNSYSSITRKTCKILHFKIYRDILK